jgi:GH15 family glucan-1,4-alpha-glucosidase
MAWVAVDRAIKSAQDFGLEAPLDDWKKLRAKIRDDVCRNGFDEKLNSFTRAYGSGDLDAALLLLPVVGFLPANDPRIQGTIRCIEKHLLVDGFVMRYDTRSAGDGLPSGEGAFLACSFWLADNYMLQGRHAEARKLFERLVSLSNDVGLLAEEYDLSAKRMVGNFPQAFSHVGLLNTAFNLGHEASQNAPKPAEQRRDGHGNSRPQ